MSASFWERAETVNRFAEREPDHRLAGLVDGLKPSSLRVLDVGCAAGRNTLWLAAQGADIYAVDASAAMVAKTRERLSGLLGREAEARVQHGGMEDLHRFTDDSFDMVLGLGIYQQAQSKQQFQQALAESARVLKVGGLCLVANFGPDSQPQGVVLRTIEGEGDTYTGFMADAARMVLLSAPDLDKAFAQVNLFPKVPTETVRRVTSLGYRTTVNALYQKGRAL